MNLDELFAQFKKEKVFLKGVREKTLIWYAHSYSAFTRFMGKPEKLDKLVLKEFVTKMRESGISITSCNVYIRGFNSFLTWLFENEQTKEHLKIKQLKDEQKVMKTYTDGHLKIFLSYKPKDWYEWRMYTLVATLIDTGCRIDEALHVTRGDIDFDNMLMKVSGKGGKERIIPFSFELRKILYRFSKMQSNQLFFGTRKGYRYRYRNALRDFKLYAQRLGIEGTRISFHTFRHTFAYNYAKDIARITGSAENGIFHLQKTLGHTSLAMTRKYVELQPEDLREVHSKTSILSRLK
jgi:integrase/recombinase XerD